MAKHIKAGCVCTGDVVSDWKNGLYRLLVTGTQRITGDNKVTLSYQYGVRVCGYKINDLLYLIERSGEGEKKSNSHYRIVHDREYNHPWIVYMVIGDYANPAGWFRTRQKAKDWVQNHQALLLQGSPE